MRTLFFLSIVLCASTSYAQDWIQYVPQTTVTERPPVVYTVPQPPLVTTRWVPRYYSPVISVYNVPVIETRRRWFLRRERLITYPATLNWYERSALYYGY
tara:strand:+ start:1325 stop:1624 length:300 start_codon:yes stop_codon:yes gene_type:complete